MLVEDVYELKLFLILALAICKLAILAFEAEVIEATDELNTLVTDAPDELRFKVTSATLPLNEPIDELKLATECDIDEFSEELNVPYPVVLAKVTP